MQPQLSNVNNPVHLPLPLKFASVYYIALTSLPSSFPLHLLNEPFTGKIPTTHDLCRLHHQQINSD